MIYYTNNLTNFEIVPIFRYGYSRNSATCWGVGVPTQSMKAFCSHPFHYSGRVKVKIWQYCFLFSCWQRPCFIYFNFVELSAPYNCVNSVYDILNCVLSVNIFFRLFLSNKEEYYCFFYIIICGKCTVWLLNILRVSYILVSIWYLTIKRRIVFHILFKLCRRIGSFQGAHERSNTAAIIFCAHIV